MGLFTNLTTDEMDVLDSHLGSGWVKQERVTRDDKGFWETADVLGDLHADRRDRWNREHPGNTY